MDYIKNNDTQSAKKITNKFRIVYAIWLIIIFPFIFFISEIVGIFLPTEYKTIFEIKTMDSMDVKEYFFDYDGGNIYYLEDFYSEYPTIYRNTNVIYQFVDEKNKEIEFIAVNEDYLYFKSENHIYKLNINTKEIETEVYCNLSDIHRISSGNNSDNYFYMNGKIYVLINK